MTAPTPDALASALPAGIYYDAAVNLRWDTARVARFQAERLAEAGYVLVHTAPDEVTVERLAEAGWRGEGGNWGLLDELPKEDLRNNVRAVLAALTDTPTQARQPTQESGMHEHMRNAAGYCQTCDAGPPSDLPEPNLDVIAEPDWRRAEHMNRTLRRAEGGDEA